jgi:hypothetical protein
VFAILHGWVFSDLHGRRRIYDMIMFGLKFSVDKENKMKVSQKKKKKKKRENKMKVHD